jgi:hypothetical protein
MYGTYILEETDIIFQALICKEIGKMLGNTTWPGIKRILVSYSIVIWQK